MPGFRIFLSGLLALTLVRLLIAAHLEIQPDEALSYVYGQELDFGYFDQGPGPALAAWIGTSGLGKSAWALRALSSLAILSASIVLFRLVASAYDSRTAGWCAALFNFLPSVNLAAVTLSPMALALPFWAVCLLFLWRGLHRSHPYNLAWPIAGICAGLAFCCHVMGGLLVVGLLVLLTCFRRWRSRLRQPGVLLFLVAFLAAASPVIYWEARQNWLPWSIELTRLWPPSSEEKLTDVWLREFFGWLWAGSPLVVGVVAWIGGLRLFRVTAVRDSDVFFLSFALPVVGALLVTGLVSRDATLTLPIWFGGIAVVCHEWRVRPAGNLLRWAAMPVATGTALIASLLSFGTGLVNLPGSPAGLIASPMGRQEIADVVGYTNYVATGVNGKETSLFILTDTPETAGLLDWYLGEETPVAPAGGRSVRRAIFPLEARSFLHQWVLWPTHVSNPAAFTGATAIYCGQTSAEEPVPSALTACFGSIESLGAYKKGSSESPVSFQLFLCIDYQPEVRDRPALERPGEPEDREESP